LHFCGIARYRRISFCGALEDPVDLGDSNSWPNAILRYGSRRVGKDLRYRRGTSQPELILRKEIRA